VVAFGLLLDAAGVPTPAGVFAAFDDFLGTPVPSPVMGLVGLLIATTPVTLIHELGHAIAARKLLDTSVPRRCHERRAANLRARLSRPHADTSQPWVSPERCA